MRDWFDTVPAGVSIWLDPLPGYGPCTVGFNAILNGHQGLVTASHCSNQPFGLDSGPVWQPLASPGRRIGEEAWDWDGDYPWCWSNFGGRCRYSDAQWSVYDDAGEALHGRIARPETAGHLAPGSLVLDSVAPYWGVADWLDHEYQVVGQWLSKVGRTSGWTRGQITSTCLSAPSPTDPGLLLLCQTRTDIHSEGWDSGAPIFYEAGQYTQPSPWDWVYAVGVLRGGPTGQTNITDYTSIQGVQWDISHSQPGSGWMDLQLWCSPGDTVYPCGQGPPPPPDTLDVTIYGPVEVPPDTFCLYWSSVSGGNSPYSYQWYRSGVPVGSQDTVTLYTGASDFLLRLDVDDAGNGSGTEEVQVTVTPLAPQCPI